MLTCTDTQLYCVSTLYTDDCEYKADALIYCACAKNRAWIQNTEIVYMCDTLIYCAYACMRTGPRLCLQGRCTDILCISTCFSLQKAFPLQSRSYPKVRSLEACLASMMNMYVAERHSAFHLLLDETNFIRKMYSSHQRKC